MKKYGSRSLTFVVAVLALLLVLFPISYTNSWFTAGDNLRVECEVIVGNFKFNVYQHLTSKNEDVLISGYEQQAGASYVDLTNESNYNAILPDESYDLNLVIKNDDLGNISLYLRYKIVLVVKDYQGNEHDVKMDITTDNTSTGNVFKLNDDGYFYYQNQAGVKQIFAKGATASMMSSFVVPYSEFYDATTNSLNQISGANVRLKIIVEGSSTAEF